MRLDGCFFLEDKSSPELFFPKLSQIVFSDIFLHSCTFCLYKPSRTCCWEASHSRTLLLPCVTVETLCSWRRAVFSNRQTYYWVWWKERKSSIFIFAFENKELSSSWLLSFPRASGRIQGESSPEHFFFKQQLSLCCYLFSFDWWRTQAVLGVCTVNSILYSGPYTFFNDMYQMMDIFNSVTFPCWSCVKFSQQRRHRTRHGLHLSFGIPERALGRNIDIS